MKETIDRAVMVLSVALTSLASVSASGASVRAFELNLGQSDRSASHLSRGDGDTVFLTNDGLVVRTPDYAFRMRLGQPGDVGHTEALSGYANHLVGPQANWRTLIPLFSVVERQAGEGLTARYRFDKRGQPVFDVQVAPGASIDHLTIRFDAPTKARVDSAGVLHLDDRVRLSAPRAEQEGEVVSSRWVERAPGHFGFDVGHYDQTKPLLIDPTIEYGTLYEAVPSAINDIDVDSAGVVYVFGRAGVATFPTTLGAFDTTFSLAEGYIGKIDPSQTGAASLIYSTYIGGSAQDQITAGATGPTDRPHFFGRMSSDFATTANAYSATPAGAGTPGYIGVLSADGTTLDYGTFFGAGTQDAIRVDSTGIVYVGGAISTSGHPVTASAFDGVRNAIDAFVSRLNITLPPAQQLLYSTFFGGTSNDYLTDLDVDNNGNIFAAMRSGSTDFPISAAAFQTTPDSLAVARFDTTASGAASRVYATFLGGSGIETQGAIAADANGNAYVTGTTLSTDFPTSLGAYQTVLPGRQSAFISKFNLTGGLVYSSFVGGPSGVDAGYDIAVNSAGESFLAHRSSITPTGCGYGPTTGIQSGLTKLNVAGSAIDFATYIGEAEARHLALRGTGSMVVAGDIDNPSFALLNGFSTTVSGTHNFVASLTTDTNCADVSVSIVADPNPTTAGNGAQFTVTVTNQGTDPADDVVLSDDLPAGLTLVTTSPRSCSQTDPVVCALGTLAPGASTTVLVRVSTSRTAPASVSNTVSVTSSSQDGDPTNDSATAVLSISQPGSPCGNVTFIGTCTGPTLTYCEGEGTRSEHLVTVDCSTVFPGSGGTCELIDSNYGNDCVVVTGDVCDFEDARSDPVYAFCEGRSPGCIFDDTTSEATCRENTTACVEPTRGQPFAPECNGGVLTLDCQVNQPVGYDCAAVGGTCTRGICGDLPVGARCDENLLSCDPANTLCDVFTERCISLGSVCDASSFTASCSGNILELCDPRVGRVVQTDCSTAFEGSGRSRCGVPFSCVNDRTGQPCDSVPPSCIGGASGDPCDPVRGIYCGRNLSCVTRLDGAGVVVSTCEGLASMCAPGAPSAGCEGDVATFCIGNREGTVVEPIGFDCGAFGSSCSMAGRTQALCEGGLGARCDDPALNPDSPLRCADGLFCVGSGRGFGTCTDSIAGDGGVRDVPGFGDGAVGDAGSADAGSNPDGGASADAGVVDLGDNTKGDADGCSCDDTNTNAASPWIGFFLFSFLFLRFRKMGFGVGLIVLLGLGADAYAKGFSGTTLRQRDRTGLTAQAVTTEIQDVNVCSFTVTDCMDPDYGVSYCGRKEAAILLGQWPGLSPCLAECEAMEPTLAQCEDSSYFQSLCGQLEASTFLIPEPPECKPPSGAAYPCIHPSTCVNLFRQSYDAAGRQFGEVMPGLALQTVVVPTTIDEQGTNIPPPGTLQMVKKPIYAPEGMRSNSVQTSLWGQHQNDVTSASNLNGGSEVARIQAVRTFWANNGDEVNSCAEYAYELFHSVSQFEDAKVTLGSDHRAIYDLAYDASTPILPSAIGRRGVLGLPQVRLDGVASPDQHDFAPTARYKNSFFAANYMNPVQRSNELQNYQPGDPRPYNSKIIILDDDLYNAIWDGRQNGGYDESWQWHLDQSTGLQPLYLDEQLFQIEKFKLNFEQLLYERLLLRNLINGVLRRIGQGVADSIPEYEQNPLFDPTIFEQHIATGSDPISQLLGAQRTQRASRYSAQGQVQITDVVSPAHGFGYDDFVTGLPGGGQTTTAFSAPVPGGTYSTRGGLSPSSAVQRATRATGSSNVGPLELAGSLVAVSGSRFQFENDLTIFQALVRELVALDELIEAALFDARDLGCLASGLNPCDWSPRMFAQRVDDLGRYREPYYERCVDYTANTGFTALQNANPFQYPNPAGGQNLTTMVNGQLCNRPFYNSDLDAVELYFDCVDQHKRDLISALQEILGKEGFVIGPPPDYAVRIGSSEGDTFETGNDMFTAAGSFDATWRMSLPNIDEANPNWCLLEPSLHASLQAEGTALFASFDLVDAQATISGEPGVASEAYLEVAGTELVRVGPYDLGTALDFNVIEDGEELSEEFVSAQTTIVVVVVPVTIRGGVAGRIGARVGLGLGQPLGGSCADADVILEGHFTPYAAVDAFASASIDALVIEAGVKITLTLVQADLPLDVALEVEGIQAGNVLGADMAVSANLDLVLSILSGYVSAFVEICYVVGCETFEQVLFRWDGPRFTQNLYSLGFEVPLLPLVSFSGGQ